MKKKIGILGSGPVAKRLGAGFIIHHYNVMLGTRDPDKLKDWKAEVKDDAKIGSFEDAAVFGDIVILAVKGTVASKVIELAGADNLLGKTVIDTTNPIADSAPENGVINYFTDINFSLMEQLQKSYPAVHFVKAFNSIGNAFMVDPPFELKPTMFICGNNEDAKAEVFDILEEFGFEIENLGGAEAARAIEPLCMLWCIPGIREGRWNHGFKLIKTKE